MSSDEDRAKAQSGLTAIREAIEAEVVRAAEQGLRNDEVARALDLETDINGGQRNHLTHAILNGLVAEARLVRERRGHRILLHRVILRAKVCVY